MALIAGLAAAPVRAEVPWGERLLGEDLRNAFIARTLGFPWDLHVDFKADGRVLMGQSWGRWWVEEDLLCLEMEAQHHPDQRPSPFCVAVWRDGIDLRLFETDEAGAVMTGDFGEARYVDLG